MEHRSQPVASWEVFPFLTQLRKPRKESWLSSGFRGFRVSVLICKMGRIRWATGLHEGTLQSAWNNAWHLAHRVSYSYELFHKHPKA